MQKFGLFKWSASKGKINFNDGIERFSVIPNIHINHIVNDRKGLVWVATSSNGAYAIDPLTDSILIHFDKNAQNELKLPDEGVASILDYNDSLMVLFTSKQLVIYNRFTKRSSIVGTPEMISGYIASTERDSSGHVWVSTTTGIYRVNIQKKIFIFFNRIDGIGNDNFTLAASLALPDGRLLFGSSTQFVAFNPYSIMLNSKFPGITITDFRVSNKSMLVDSLLRLKKIVLGPSSNSLQIEFSTLNFNNAYLIKYKLEGIDKEWNIADKNNQAIYSYLPPGTYTFLAKTLDSEANEGENITRIIIRIKPHFWNTWWFYSLCAVLFAIAIFLVDRERMKRKESIRKMRNDIAGNLHTEVNTALNNINLLSEMARIKADQDPQKSKEYIEQIHTKSHNMIIAMDDMLWSLDEGNDNIDKTVDRMREYIDALRNRTGENIDLLVDKKIALLPLNMSLRHTSFQLFKEGIKNIISTGAKNLKVHLGAEKNILQFTIQFDNEDCDMQQLHNLLHRQDLEKKLQSINAEIGIEVHKTSSVINLQIPVK
jgi:signal transduction histidine kinase